MNDQRQWPGKDMALEDGKKRGFFVSPKSDRGSLTRGYGIWATSPEEAVEGLLRSTRSSEVLGDATEGFLVFPVESPGVDVAVSLRVDTARVTHSGTNPAVEDPVEV